MSEHPTIGLGEIVLISSIALKKKLIFFGDFYIFPLLTDALHREVLGTLSGGALNNTQ